MFLVFNTPKSDVLGERHVSCIWWSLFFISEVVFQGVRVASKYIESCAPLSGGTSGVPLHSGCLQGFEFKHCSKRRGMCRADVVCAATASVVAVHPTGAVSPYKAALWQVRTSRADRGLPEKGFLLLHNSAMHLVAFASCHVDLISLLCTALYCVALALMVWEPFNHSAI
jgi:hypothetical protein